MMTVLIIAALLFVLAGILLVVYRHRNLPRHMTAHDRAAAHVKLHAIEQQLKTGGPAHLRQAVIEADKLVDHVLKKQGVQGDTMGDRLRSAHHRFSDYDGLWKAHRVRNQLVHEVDKELLSFEAKQSIERFRRALHDLGVS